MRKLSLLLIPVVLAGCLGGKNAPDATLVVDAPPLVVPPNFDLRPPKGDVQDVAAHAARQDYKPENEAAGILLGEDVVPVQKKAPAALTTDQWLLERAGSASRNPSIRDLMAREAYRKEMAEKKEKSRGWFSRKFSKDSDVMPVGDVTVNEELLN